TSPICAIRTATRSARYTGWGKAANPVAASSRQRLPACRGTDRRLPQVIRRLAAMQRLSDLANRHEGRRARFFDFERLFAIALNKADETVQHRQRGLRRLALGCVESFQDFCGLLGVGHGASDGSHSSPG